MAQAPAVLFVCLGNICRSPLAEAAFRQETARLGLDVRIDSAGTGDWNIGRAPDPRAQAVAARDGVDISGMRARQIVAGDFRAFTHIVALDPQNLADLEALRPADATVSLSLLLDHVPGREGQAVADPYYSDAAAFDLTWREIRAGTAALASKIGAALA